MKKGKQKTEDVLINKLLELIPEKNRNEFVKENLGRMVGPRIRVQIRIPIEYHMVLYYFGAYSESESAFYSRMAREFIEEKAVPKANTIELLTSKE